MVPPSSQNATAVCNQMVPPSSQNAKAVCNQLTLLALYYISSRLVTFLKVMNAPIQVSDCFNLFFPVLSSSILVLDIPSFCS